MPASLELLYVIQTRDRLGADFGPGQRRKQQGRQDRDDRDYHKQFDEGKRGSAADPCDRAKLAGLVGLRTAHRVFLFVAMARKETLPQPPLRPKDKVALRTPDLHILLPRGLR